MAHSPGNRHGLDQRGWRLIANSKGSSIAPEIACDDAAAEIRPHLSAMLVEASRLTAKGRRRIKGPTQSRWGNVLSTLRQTWVCSALHLCIVSILVVSCTTTDEIPVPIYEPPTTSETLNTRISGNVREVPWAQPPDVCADITSNIPPDRRYWSTVCATVDAIDGRVVKQSVDCAAAIPISPGDHAVRARLSSVDSKIQKLYSTAVSTVSFTVTAGHSYKMCLEGASSGARARLWIRDQTTQTAVTPKILVVSPLCGGCYALYY